MRIHQNAIKSKRCFSDRTEIIYEINFTDFFDISYYLFFSDSRVKYLRLDSDGSEDVVDPGFYVFSEGNQEHDIYSLLVGLDYSERTRLLELRYLQLGVLALLNNISEARQLFSSNVVLAWMLCHYIDLKGMSYEEAKVLLRYKRKELLSLMGGIGTKSCVKFCGKITLFKFSKVELETILRSIKDKNFIDGFKHWDNVSVKALYISLRKPIFVGTNLLRYFSCLESDSLIKNYNNVLKYEKLINDTVNLGRQVNQKNAEEIVYQCFNLDELNALHDNWVKRLVKEHKYYEPDLTFPSTGLIFPDGMTHISTANQLIDEGKEMKHCVATYVKRALTGKSIFASLTWAGERATIEIVSNRERLRVVEMKTYNNKDVSEELGNYVNKWILEEKSRFGEEVA